MKNKVQHFFYSDKESFKEYLNEDMAITRSYSTGPMTSFDNSHRHIYETDRQGNGVTTEVIPNDYNLPHEHKVKVWKVHPSGNDSNIHVHTIYDYAI